jgi:hypothetical protein
MMGKKTAALLSHHPAARQAKKPWLPKVKILPRKKKAYTQPPW